MEVNMSSRLVESMKEAVAYAKGDVSKGETSKHQVVKALSIPENLNPRDIRQKLKMTQEEFSARFGFNLYTLRNWEHNRRHPDQAVLAYLYAISKHPEEIEEALRS